MLMEAFFKNVKHLDMPSEQDELFFAAVNQHVNVVRDLGRES